MRLSLLFIRLKGGDIMSEFFGLLVAALIQLIVEVGASLIIDWINRDR